MKNKNFGRKRQAIYILSNRKSTRIIKTLMDFFFFIKVKIKMVCFSVPSYIPKLWKFINTSLPNKLSNLGDSRIVFHLKHQAVHLILCHKLFLALFCILIHRPDLIDLEDPSILPNSLL